MPSIAAPRASRAAEFNIALEDVSITHMTFGKEFTKAVEQKQIAQQDAERARFIVEKAEQERQANRTGCDPPVPLLPITPDKHALEGVRRRLEALDARPQQLSRIAHDVTPRASRNDERARCSRTRTLAGLMPSARAASSVSMSSQSMRINASR